MVEPPEELVRLRAENARLQYRLSVLKNAVAGIEGDVTEMEGAAPAECVGTDSRETGQCLFVELSQLFSEAISAAFPGLAADSEAAPSVCLSSTSKFADYQCNAAMPLAKRLSAGGSKHSPRQVAAAIVAHVPENSAIERLEVAGAGFINVHVRRSAVAARLRHMLVHALPAPVTGAPTLRVVVDYCSPNVAKEMHVGHLRSTVIGDSIARLLEFLGHEVVGVNHVGDWGTQFGMLLAHMEDSRDECSKSPPAIADLQAFYRQSKRRFDEEPQFKRRAYDQVVRLQSRESGALASWRQICDISLREFELVLRRLEVRPLLVRGESFYQDKMQAVVAELEERGMLVEEEGRKLMFVPDCSLPLTVVKSDGAFTYDTSDLAAIRHRVFEQRGDWIVYVVDAGQAVHLETVFAAARHLGWTEHKHRIDHVQFGVVLGEDGKKFRTRSGDTVRLAELLDEGLRRARAKLQERGAHQQLSAEELTQAERAIAYGCIKYADLSHNRLHEYVFSFDKMLDDRGNTAVYLLYSLTRIRSIVRRSGLSRAAIVQEVVSYDRDLFSLQHEREWRLAKVLVRFPEVLVRAARDLLLHQLCDYLYEVSGAFTEFYDVCQCISVERNSQRVLSVDMQRMALCEATALVMQRCFDILGIQTLQKM